MKYQLVNYNPIVLPISLYGLDSYGYDFNDVVYVTYQGTTTFIEEDVITIYGTVQGSHTYESTAGHTITIPLIEADIIE